MSDPVTPNMNLIQPVTGVTPGSTANDEYNANWTTIDGHDHSPGRGAPITPSGFTINTDLTFSGYNATSLRSTRFTIQPAALSDPADVACLYFTGVDLWANDGAGNQIQITSGGGVNATSSGISSGTASASFVASVLVVNADTNKPANIRGASLLLGNNVTNSKYLTLSPPNAMGADYGLVLPPIPGVNSIMGIDTSGNMTGAYTTDNSTIEINGSSQIAIKAQGVTQDLLAPRSTGSTVGAGGVAVSADCLGFSTTSITGAAITNMSVTITTTGRPVCLAFQSSGTGSNGEIGGRVTSGILLASFFFKRGSTVIPTGGAIELTNTGAGSLTFDFLTPGSAIRTLDFVAAGTYTYTAWASNPNGFATYVRNCVLVAYEI